MYHTGLTNTKAIDYNIRTMLLVDSFALLIGAGTALFGLGLVTGFSPTLYVTQLGITLRRQHALSHMAALIAGVVIGTVLLGVLFQIFHPQILTHIFSINIGSPVANAWFNTVIGTGIIAGGVWYARSRQKFKKPKQEPHIDVVNTRYVATVVFAALKTILSASGAAAIFLAGNIIVDAPTGIIGRLILIAIYLAATILPFVIMMVTSWRSPARLATLKKSVQTFTNKINYRHVMGVIAIIIGVIIVCINVPQVMFS